MNIEIKKVDTSRFDELNLFNNSNFNEYKEKRIKQINNKEADIFVVEYNNKYIGEITIKYINGELKTETIPNKRVYLEAFRIYDKYHNLKIGSKLLDYVIKSLKDKGYIEVTVGVEENNNVAKHIYSKYGFNKKIDIGYDKELKEEYTLYMKRI